MAALTPRDVLEFLDNHDQIGPADQNPWPGYEPDEFDTYQLDWRRLFDEDELDLQPPDSLDEMFLPRIRDAWGAGPPVIGSDEAEQMAGRRPEVCAWYQPIHFHGPEWGIFILDDCLRAMAIDMARFAPQRTRSGYSSLDAQGICRMAFATLFLHEVFHHKIESFAIRLHAIEGVHCYRRYWNMVYSPLTRPGAAGPLEEALANADSYQRLTEPTYARRAEGDTRSAARDYLKWRLPFDPPGYRDAVHYLNRDDFDAGQYKLFCQIQEGTQTPSRTASDWAFAPGVMKGFFNIASDIWVVVPRGRSPLLPTFPLYRPVPTARLESKLHAKFGYDRVPGGKGSHVKLKSAGRPTVMLPGNRKDVSPVVLRNTAKSLGFRDPGELLAALGL